MINRPFTGYKTNEMSKSHNGTFSDWAKLGYIEVDGKLVKAESLVVKKVEKIDEAELWGIKKTPQEILSDFNKNGILFVKDPKNAITLPNGETLYIKYSFDLTPFPAPRMTRSDQWKTDPNHPDPAKRQRKPVARYFAWRNAFVLLCNQKGYTLQERLYVVFIMPMPKYFSRAKRASMLNQPHKQRPDTDNMLKSIKDAFASDDGFVWDERGIKIWGDKGKILIINN